MANNCWYCRKGGIVDLYMAGRVGICPICRSGVNVVVNFDVPTIEITAPNSESNEPLTMAQLEALPDGAKLYSYAKSSRGRDNHDFEGIVTVNAKEKKIIYASGGYNWFKSSAIDGTQNMYNRRLYFKELDLNADKPLTLEELKQMDGEKVWLSRFIDGVEQFDENACGWWTVDAKNALLNKIGSNSWDRIGNIGTRFGFNAYRTDQSHRAKEKEDDSWEELPF